LNESGYRLISIFAAYTYGFTHFWGVGIGNWSNGILEAINQTNIDITKIDIYKNGTEIVSTRPTSFFAAYILDFGISGLIFIYILLKKYLNALFSNIEKPLFIVFLINITILGDIGNPIPWIIVALAYRFKSINL
jgi:hypothetical protein